jgi:hypothetical protein
LGITPIAVQHWFLRRRQASSSDATGVLPMDVVGPPISRAYPHRRDNKS